MSIIPSQKQYSWTLEKWQKLIESGILDDEKIELIEGKIIKMSPERADHAYYNGKLAKILRSLLETTNKAVIREAHPVTLKRSEPEPDIAIVRSPDSIYLQHHPYPEDIYWLAEISRSTLNFDLNQKLALYASAAIPEYWVVDLRARKLIIFSQVDPASSSYKQKREVAAAEDVEIILPGFSDLSMSSLEIWQID